MRSECIGKSVRRGDRAIKKQAESLSYGQEFIVWQKSDCVRKKVHNQTFLLRCIFNNKKVI